MTVNLQPTITGSTAETAMLTLLVSMFISERDLPIAHIHDLEMKTIECIFIKVSTKNSK